MKAIKIMLPDASYDVLTRFLDSTQNTRLEHQSDGQMLRKRVIQSENDLITKVITERIADFALHVPDPTVIEKRRQIEELQREIAEASKPSEVVVSDEPVDTPVVVTPPTPVTPEIPNVPGRSK